MFWAGPATMTKEGVTSRAPQRPAVGSLFTYQGSESASSAIGKTIRTEGGGLPYTSDHFEAIVWDWESFLSVDR